MLVNNNKTSLINLSAWVESASASACLTILEDEIKWKFIELVASVSLHDTRNIGYRNELSDFIRAGAGADV